MKTFGIARKTASILANLSLFLNTFLPFVIAVQPVYAQNPEEVVPEIVEVSPTPQPSIAVDSSPADPTPENSPTPSSVEPSIIPQPTITPEVTPTPEISPVAEATPTPEPSVEPTPTQFNGELAETTPTPVNSEIGSLTPDVQNTPTPNSQPAESTPEVEQVCLENNQNIVDSTNDLWTINDVDKISETTQKVQLGIKYIFPSDNKVSVTFKCLPKDEALRTTLKIQQVKTSDLKLPDNMGSLGEYAYDITTGMTDGTFEYDVTLPKTSDSTAEISYIEKSLEQAKLSVSSSEINTIDESKIEQQDNSVKASNIDHFTIFIIVNPDETLVDNSVENQDSGWVSDNNYATFDSNNDYADYGFPNLGIPSGSIIEGIEVYVEGYTSGRDFDISLWNQSNGIDEYTSLKNANLGNSESTITLGGPTDKWGKTWTDADFDTNFKVRVDATSGGNTAYLDMVQVKVYYTEPISVTPPVLPNNPSDTYALTSVTGNWTAISGGSGHQGIGTTEIRWGTPAGVQKSGLRFTNSGAQSFNSGDTFYLGMLTHMNWGTYAGTAANGATLQITLNFNRPNIPNPVFTYDFDIEETSNSAGSCRPYQVSSTPCDDKITFPTSYGTQVVTIGDIQYTLVIDGFVNAYPSGSAVPAFITEEQRENSALLVGHLSSELIPAPAINIEKKTNNVDVTTSPGPELNTGDSVNWQYIVQNIGNVDLTSITVVDDKVGAITCPSSSLPASAIPSERVMTCTASGIVAAGQYTNTATVTAYHTNGTVTDSDSSWYFGINQKGHITVQKTTLPAGDSTVFTTYLTHNTNGTHLATGTISDSTDYTFDVDAGTYKIVEDVPSGWGATSNPCLNGVTVAAGETKYCAIENQKLPVLTVEKVLIGDTAPYSDFSFKVDGGTATPFESDGNNQIYIVPGQAYNLTESDPGSIYNVSYSAGCSGNLTYNQTATCTITNTKYGSLTIIKDANPHSSQSFSFTTSGTGLSNFSLTDDSSDFLSDRKTFNNLLPGTYSVAESSVSGWDLSDVTCTDGSSNTAINLSAGENITCTFTNTMRGAIGGHKYHDADGNIFTTDDRTLVPDWNITLINNDTGTSVSTITDQNGSYSFTNIIPGSYTLTEGSRSGWYHSGTQSLNVTLSPGQNNFGNDFINTQFASVTLYKNVDTDGDGDIDDTHSTNWKWNLEIGSTNTEHSTGAVINNLYPGLYTISEQQQSGYRVTSLICNNGIIGADNHYGAVESQTITLSSGQNLVCTFTNTKLNPALTIVKTATPLTYSAVGTTISYSYKVTNSGNVSLAGPVTINDDKATDESCPLVNTVGNFDNKLDPTEEITCTASYIISQADLNAGSVTNIASASADGTTSPTDTETVTANQTPTLTIVKTATPSTYDEVGDVISYSFLVTNSGNVSLDGPVTIDDDKTTDETCPAVTTVGNSDNQLDPGESLTCTASYSIKLADLNAGSITNKATASADGTTSNEDTKTVTALAGKIIIEKQTLPDGHSQSFEFNPSWSETNFNLKDGESNNSGWLAPGSYSIVEILPDNWSLTGITCNDSNSQAAVGAAVTANINLEANETVTCTFNNAQKTLPLFVNKFEDHNANGLKDIQDNSLDGWTMELYDNETCTGSPLSTITTDSVTSFPGTAKFENLYQGNTYWVKEVEQPNWLNTTGNCQAITIHDDPNNYLEFGNFHYGQVSGYKFEDLDGNHILDIGETYLKDWEIRLYADNHDGGWNLLGTTTTNSNGQYVFSNNLQLNNYKICEVLKTDWIQSYPIDTSGGNNHDEATNCHFFTVNASGQIFSKDFGNFQKSQVTVYKFHDLNANGTREENEPFLSDWEMTITPNGDTNSIKQLTNSNGNTLFKLEPGQYVLDETIKDNWYQSNIYCEDTGPGVLITAPGEAYGHHGWCGGWNGCSDAATCALWACEVKGYSNLVSYGEARPCTQFNNCNLFYYRGSVQMNWGNGCEVSGVTDIVCSNGSGSTPALARISLPVSGNNLTISPGRSKTCYVGNYQKATITLYKDVINYNDADIEDAQLFTVDGGDLGVSGFAEGSPISFTVDPGTYSFSEIDIPNNYELVSENNRSLTVISGSQNSLTFTNKRNPPPKLTIAKQNNVTGNLSPGDAVEYTINLDINDNDITNLKVTDLLSNGFVYRLGSYHVFQNDIDVTSLVGEPQYHSPGLWDLSSLGKLTPDDEIKLVYTADIASDQQPGKYTDLAWAISNYAYEDDSLLAQAQPTGYVDTNFVGTIVPIAKNSQNSVSAEVEQKVEGQVLGASTELPATGASVLWLILSGVLGFVGISLLKINKKYILTLLFVLLSGGLMVKPVFAANFVLSIQELKTPSNTKDLKLEFKALHLNNGVITAKCLKKGPSDSGFSQFGSDIVLSAGGNSSYCDLSNAINDNGSYQFTVQATDGVDTATKTVSLDYNTSTPGTPHDYRKENINSNNCDFKIHFKTDADSGKTVKVELYRSTDSAFSANNESLVHSVNIGSDQEYDIYNSVPDCSKTYYYALRAFDNTGNGSGLIGDRITITTTTTTTETTVNQADQTTGAIPVIGADIPSETNPTITPEGQEETTLGGDTGQVLGTQKGTIADFVGRHKFISGLIGVGILAIIIYAFKKIRKGKKNFRRK